MVMPSAVSTVELLSTIADGIGISALNIAGVLDQVI